MPISVETIEQTVLGHALTHQACYDNFVSNVAWQDFVVPNHKVIAFCLQRMAAMQIKRPDEDTFQLVVGAYPGDKNYGGIKYIRELKHAFKEPTDNYDHLVAKFKVQSAKAGLGSEHMEHMLKLLNDPNSEVIDIRQCLNKAMSRLDAVDSTSIHLENTVEIGKQYLEALDARGNQPFSTTGLPPLDEVLSEGFVSGKITVMAGFTGMGKSMLGVTMAHRIAVTGAPAAIFSMESQKTSVYDRLVSTLTSIPVTRLKKEVKSMQPNELAAIDNAVECLDKLPLLISDKASVTIDDIRYQIRVAQQRDAGPDVVFIDLFGKVEDVDQGDNLAAKIQKECKRMRVLAQELGTHFVLIVQIGRQGYGITTRNVIKRPNLVQIKNANAYAEECDTCFLLHRNKYYLPDLEDDILEVNVAKQREGEANLPVYFELFPETATVMQTNKLPHDITTV
jgi:replicative DNA helicase